MGRRSSWTAAPARAAILVLAGAAFAQAPPIGRTESCVGSGCHGEIISHEVLHGPTAQHKCQACHATDELREHRFRLTVPEAKLCTTCHVRGHRTYLHEPVRLGTCTGCHDPHGSAHPMMLVADPVQGLCAGCHDESLHAGRFVHGPVAAGACILCHDSHSSWEPALLTEPPRTLCLGCHDVTAGAADGDLRSRHAPVDDGCLLCHDAHASDVRGQLVAAAPELCYRCHEATRSVIEQAAVVHGASTGEGGCTACHAPHESILPALQRREQPALCLDCHDRPLIASDGHVLTDMAALLRDNPDHHGPVRAGECTACHRPHAAENALLLRKAYPPEFYAPFERRRYALCFECHIPEMIERERGTGLTRFRDGERNLHWLHVNRDKGRTCRACHEVHASRNPFHIRDSVPFGSRGWELEIRFERTDTGGRCAPGCHAPKTYDRGGDAEGGPA